MPEPEDFNIDLNDPNFDIDDMRTDPPEVRIDNVKKEIKDQIIKLAGLEKDKESLRHNISSIKELIINHEKEALNPENACFVKKVNVKKVNPIEVSPEKRFYDSIDEIAQLERKRRKDSVLLSDLIDKLIELKSIYGE